MLGLGGVTRALSLAVAATKDVKALQPVGQSSRSLSDRVVSSSSYPPGTTSRCWWRDGGPQSRPFRRRSLLERFPCGAVAATGWLPAAVILLENCEENQLNGRRGT